MEGSVPDSFVNAAVQVVDDTAVALAQHLGLGGGVGYLEASF